MYDTGYDSNHRLMPKEEELECLQDYQAGCPLAARKLVELNIRMVFNAVQKFGNTRQAQSIDKKDLVQEGIMGLVHAAGKFDTDRGLRFSTYCVLWIEQSVRRYVMNSSKTIRIPVHLYNAASKVNGIREEHGFTEYEDIFKQLHADYDAVDEENIKNGKGKVNRISLTKSTFKELPLAMVGMAVSEGELVAQGKDGDDIETSFLDTCLDETINIEALPEDDSIRKILKWIDLVLSEREAKVFILRNGIGVDQMTLDEVGVVIGVTRERVRQIQLEAKNKLKGPWAQSISPLN